MYHYKYIKYKDKINQTINNSQIGGAKLVVLTANDKEIILQKDPIMYDIYFNKKLDLFNIFPGTLYYYYYDNDDLVAHAYIQSPQLNNIIHPVTKKPMYGMYYIYAVETIELFRGKGYMQKMLSEILDPNKSYFLRVKNDNGPAIHIYKKFGFKYCMDSGPTEQIMILLAAINDVPTNFCLLDTL